MAAAAGPPPHAPPNRGRLVPPAEVAALPEVAIVRRSTLVAAWLAPYDPSLQIGHPATAVATSLAGLCPDAFRGAAAYDTETRLAHQGALTEGGGGAPAAPTTTAAAATSDAATTATATADAPAGADTATMADAAATAGAAAPGAAAASDGAPPPQAPPLSEQWDPGEVAADGAAGVLGLRFLSMSAMHVPVARDGPYLVGHVVTDVVLDRVTALACGLAFFPPLSRFAFDSTTGQLVLASARDDGGAVSWSTLITSDDDPAGPDARPAVGTSLAATEGGGAGGGGGEGEKAGGGGGEETVPPPGGGGGDSAAATAGGGRGGSHVHWLASTWLRPPAGTAGGRGLPVLASRTSTLVSPPVAGAAAAAAPTDDPVPEGPLADFLAAMGRGSTFGAAAVSTEAPVGGGSACGDAEHGFSGGEGAPDASNWHAPDGIFSMVVTTERSSRSVLQRLCSLALSTTPVQPARLRLPPPATPQPVALLPRPP